MIYVMAVIFYYKSTEITQIIIKNLAFVFFTLLL